MPHRIGPSGEVLSFFAAGSGHPEAGQLSTSLGFFPAPGDAQTGIDVGGIITDIIQRIPLPLPRPRLPIPKPKGRFPIPIPIPIPGVGPFFGDEGCPGCCKGFHIAKTTDQSAPSFGQCVRNRRMNSLNPRALRRATRRLKGFERAVKSTRKQLRTLAKI